MCTTVHERSVVRKIHFVYLSISFFLFTKTFWRNSQGIAVVNSGQASVKFETLIQSKSGTISPLSRSVFVGSCEVKHIRVLLVARKRNDLRPIY